MPKVTIEVPEELAEAVSKVTAELEAGLAAIGSGKPLDFAEWERRAAASVAEMEREVVRRLLRGLDVDAAHVRVDGRLHARVGRYPATYRTQAGPVEVERSLYREVGLRNGPHPGSPASSGTSGCVIRTAATPLLARIELLAEHGTRLSSSLISTSLTGRILLSCSLPSKH